MESGGQSAFSRFVRNKNTGAAGKRAFVFADPAAETFFADDVRIFYHLFCPVGCQPFADFKSDRLVGNGAVLLADQAVLVASVRDAEVFVEDGSSERLLLLLFECQLPDRTGRADLPAEIAVVFAVARAHFGKGCPEAGKPVFDTIGLQTGSVRCADAHALKATDALPPERILVQRAGRSDEIARVKRTLRENPFAGGYRKPACC